MRKYYQAALAVTAVVSLVCLLFYRHEYNKLRYVLEVFNYFGKPNQKSIEANCTNNVPVFSKFNMRFEEPISSWQKLDNDLYVYSAYNMYEKEVKVISFGSLNSIKDKQCVIFFENEIKPMLGSFRYTLINNSSDTTNADKNSIYNGYYLHCKYVQSKTPVGITFTMSNANLDEAPILAVKSLSYNFNYTNVAVCVTPPLIRPMYSSDMIAFINFHDIIGMDNFIVYDFGIPNEFNNRLKEFSRSQSPYWKFTYTIVSWNFPFFKINPTVIKDLIQADCLYRTYNKVGYIATLSWEDYIVLKYHHYFVDLMKDMKRSRMKADRYKLNTQTFCTQQADKVHVKNSSIMIFKKTHFDPNIIDHRPIYIYDGHDSLNKNNVYTREIEKDLVTLNRYKYCIERTNPEESIEDSSILRFTEDILNSSIFKKFTTENKVLQKKR